jgi:hypothetical protein
MGLCDRSWRYCPFSIPFSGLGKNIALRPIHYAYGKRLSNFYAILDFRADRV